MNLIKINLLPYRQILEQKQKKRFQVILGIGAAAGLVVCGLIYSGLVGLILSQEGRNSSLEDGIRELDTQIVQIKDLNKQKQSFLERKLKVEELANKRFEGARIVDTLNQLVPDGVYLTELAGDDNNVNSYTITGKAINDDKVAQFMTSLPSTGVFEQPQLIGIKKTDNGQEFILSATLVEQKIVPVASESAASQPAEGEIK